QHRLVLPRGRVRHIDDDVRAGERFGQPLAGDGVDARRGGGRHSLVAPPAQEGEQFFPNEPAAADYHDLHVGSPCLLRRIEPFVELRIDQRAARSLTWLALTLTFSPSRG